MGSQRKEEKIAIPKWDVALEALLTEEYGKKGDELKIEDLLRIGKKNNIRFDDMIVTLFEMCIDDLWRYFDANSNEHRFTREEVNKLYRNGRINPTDVRHLDGGFSPGRFI